MSYTGHPVCVAVGTIGANRARPDCPVEVIGGAQL